MVKMTKRMNLINSKVDTTKQYSFIEAISLLKELTTTNFIESVDISVHLNIDIKKSDQNIRGATVLPHGTGRSVRVIVFSHGQQAEDAKKAGADMVGMEELAKKIKNGYTKFDVVIASPDSMNLVKELGQILGTKGLMPNLKEGTITSNIKEAVNNAKTGQIRYRNDKNGIIHSTIGKINFDILKLKENLEFLLTNFKKFKTMQSKGDYIKKINISTTMGTGLCIDQSSLKF
ncbi:MAG: 50S ribosomal protein L1 [Pantoea sp. Brub]|nr:50S ribosomal protein L1 [Pantoea sp. Brub]